MRNERFLLVMLAAGTCQADTLLSVCCASLETGVGISVEATSWTLSKPHTSVSVYATLAAITPPSRLTAYLTNKIGPGTTTVNEIARVDFSVTDVNLSTVTLFTNLTLPAGTYFLILAGGSGGAWLTSKTAPATRSGVTFNGAYRRSGTTAGYQPSTDVQAATEIPIFAVTGTPQAPSFAGAQVADGAGWKTSFAIANLDSVPASFTLRFWGGDGKPLPLLPVAGLSNPLSEISITIPVGGGQFIETPGTSTTLSQGWAELVSTNHIGGTSIFRQRVAGRPDFEAAVPLVTAINGRLILPVDNKGGYVTSVAVVNTDQIQSRTIGVTFRDENGASIGTGSLTLPPKGQTAFAFPDQFPVSAGQRGVAEFAQPDSAIAVLGLRFNPGGAFASVSTLD